MRVRKRLLFGLLLLILNIEVFGQLRWSKWSTPSDTRLLSFCLDSNGNAYMTLYGNEKIYHWNSNEIPAKFKTLPLVGKTKFNPHMGEDIQVMLDYNNEPVAVLSAVVYEYKNGQFNKVILKDSTVWPLGDARNTKFDNNGIIHVREHNLIYTMSEKWNTDSDIPLFQADSSDIIDNIFPYDSTHNYAVVNSRTTGTTIVYLYHSHQSYTKKLISTRYSTTSRNSYVSPEGEIYLPTSIGLLHFKEINNNYVMDMPVIDPNLGSGAPVNRIFKSLKNDFLVAFLKPGFYFSFDKGKQWLRPVEINRTYPKEVNSIVRLYALDTGRVIIHAIDECAYDILFEHNLNTGWNRIDAGTENSYYFDFQKIDRLGILIAKDYDCNYSYSKDDGRTWKVLDSPGKFPQRLKAMGTDKQEYFFTWINGAVYRSTDPSISWDSISRVPSGIDKIHVINSSELLASSVLNPISPASEVVLSRSTDKGLSWVQWARERVSNLPSQVIMEDPDGNLISFNPYNRESNVCISKDRGRSWSRDQRFNRFTHVQSVVTFGNNAYYIIGRVMPLNKFEYNRLYYTEDFIDFKELTPHINTSVHSVHVLGKNELLLTLQLNETLTSPFLYSDQNGENWVDVSGDFSSIIPQERVSSNLVSYLDSKNQLYISLANDGLYKTLNPVQVKNPTTHSKKLHITKLSGGELKVEVPEIFLNSNLGIYSIDMKEIYRLRITDLVTILNLELPPGVYFAKTSNVLKAHKFFIL